MKTISFISIFFSCVASMVAQKKMDRTLRVFNNGTVPYIQVSEAVAKDSLVFLDTRKLEEFKISHLEQALWVGYDQFDAQHLQNAIPNLNTPIVVYCSIGVRSEDIGERLQEMGYTNIQNLYGGIFKWKNLGYPVFDTEGNETEKVHAYNRLWGRLLEKGEKIYE
ncbi:rhodanese-like domain-containing protein [Maribacter polysiphoniae]|uniref:Rhodanese-like domain-containing protein n=1 Tax=Maribacter polysiphoniae TaxID=429344 RepID=A0A316E7K4_9FLAO|nr:rhodanese-like domain-containing protein [Maribacter polysiphoniae]MBD1260510.1 rhodanese-like domain-containing protein [Maribacter polysiphoniae]PWK25975.1 rhodanese-related sulfurtransferase [Maribacter polysiphoniae]